MIALITIPVQEARWKTQIKFLTEVVEVAMAHQDYVAAQASGDMDATAKAFARVIERPVILPSNLVSRVSNNLVPGLNLQAE